MREQINRDKQLSSVGTKKTGLRESIQKQERQDKLGALGKGGTGFRQNIQKHEARQEVSQIRQKLDKAVEKKGTAAEKLGERLGIGLRRDRNVLEKAGVFVKGHTVGLDRSIQYRQANAKVNKLNQQLKKAQEKVRKLEKE